MNLKRVRALPVAWCAIALGCVASHRPPASAVRTERIVPGITVLLQDSIQLVSGKRVGLLTNQTGIDQSGRSDAALLTGSPAAIAARVQLVVLFSPEHGLSGTEDRQFVAGGDGDRDARAGVLTLRSDRPAPTRQRAS